MICGAAVSDVYKLLCRTCREPRLLKHAAMAGKIKVNWYTVTAVLFFLASTFSLASFWWFRHHMYADYNFNYESEEWNSYGQRIRGKLGCDTPSSTQNKWAQLTSFEKTGAGILGWTNVSWDAGSPLPSCYSKVWSELTASEKNAAESLGYSESSWDCGRFYYKNQECSKLLWAQPNTSNAGIDRQVWNSRLFLFYSLGFQNHSDDGRSTTNTYDVVDSFGETAPVSKHFRRIFIGDMNILRWLNFALTLAAGFWIFMEFMSVVDWVRSFMKNFKSSMFGRFFTSVVMFVWPFVALVFFASFAHVVLSTRMTVDALGHPCFFPEAWSLNHLSVELVFWMYAAAFGGWFMSRMGYMSWKDSEMLMDTVEFGPSKLRMGSQVAYSGI